MSIPIMNAPVLVALLLGSVLCGCSADDPAPAGPKRTLVTGNLLVGTPVNLVQDPGFSLLDPNGGSGGFYAYSGLSSTPLTITSLRDSRSPAGLRGSVAVLTAPNATDDNSESIELITWMTGGPGAFHAEVWVSRSTLAGTPASFEASRITAAVIDQTGNAARLVAVEADARSSVDGRRWLPFRADLSGGFDTGGYFSITFGTDGGSWLVAAPSVVAQPLADALGTRSLATRPQTALEQSAVAKMRALRRR